jgi:hypothetical protein
VSGGLHKPNGGKAARRRSSALDTSDLNSRGVAFIGAPGHFPSARDVDAFRQNLRIRAGSLSLLSNEELAARTS